MKLHKRTLELIIIIVALVGISMSGTVVPQLYAPKDRVFEGFHEYSSDYIQYVSYIKEGMYGRYSMYFRSYPFDQPATSIHWAYIFFGILFGPLGLTAPLIYHVVRVILAVLMLWYMYVIFLKLFRVHRLALISVIIAAVSSCFSWVTYTGGALQVHVLNYFPFSLSTPQRLTDRPHYILGSILFLAALLLVLQKNRRYTPAILFILSFLTVMVHISSGIALGMLSVVLVGMSYIKKSPTNAARIQGLSIAAGCITAAAITYYFVQIYSKASNIFIDQYAYAGLMTWTTFVREFISFGPLLWIGLPGLVYGIWSNEAIEIEKRILVCAWGIIHLVLFFFLYPIFRVDQVRFMQSLYFIPLTYGTVWAIWAISKRFGRILFTVGITLVLFVSLPMYLSIAYNDLFAMTDYKQFQSFGFPTKNQFAAFTYLDTKSPKESIVVASFEVANSLLMYSHNRIIGNDQGWSAEEGLRMKNDVGEFFSGRMSPNAALSYLTVNHISYVYYGYQEQSYGDISGYPFLKKVYENPEVTIYQVATK